MRICTAILAVFALTLAGCGGNSTAVSNPRTPSITSQPAAQSVTVGQTATFSVVASGTAPLIYQWQKGTAAIAGATSAGYITPPTTLADSLSKFQVVVSNSAGSATSNQAVLTVNPIAGTTDVLTYHNDNARTGQNLNETVLTSSNVNSTTFGKLAAYTLDGRVDAQPLYVSSVTIPGQGVHNLLIVPTEHNSVYAVDADTGTVIWQTRTLKTGEQPSDDRGCGQVSPEIGVTNTRSSIALTPSLRTASSTRSPCRKMSPEHTSSASMRSTLPWTQNSWAGPRRFRRRFPELGTGRMAPTWSSHLVNIRSGSGSCC